MAVAPALEVRSVSKCRTSSSSSFLHLNDSCGLGVAVASGSGFRNSLMRALECRVVLEDLLPYEELLKSTLAITLWLGITQLQSARRRQQAELEGVACTIEEHDGLMGILLNELDDAWHELTGDQLPISAVLGSAPIPYRVYSAPTFGIPDQSAIGRLLHVSRLPGSPDYFSIFPAVYPTSCQPSTATWLNNPRLSPSGLRSTVYWLLSPFDLVLQRLWRQPIIATHDFLFQINRFPRSPRLVTRVVQITFLFRSRLLLPISVVSFSQLLRLAIVWFPCFLSSPFL